MDLATTKVEPPALPRRLIRRARLDDALHDAVTAEVGLVLVSAPAGSGKSTLLASWMEARTEDVAWLQTEVSDSDPARFWSSVVDAIGRTRPAVARKLHPVVVGSRGDELAVIPALVNALAHDPAAMLLVLDDYHLLDSESVHRGVERLISLLPRHVTVVLATRADPPFRLGRLRVRDQLVEIRASDLRFAPDEAADLLRSGGIDLATVLVEKLCDHTEGWAAGLVLAGLALPHATDPDAFVAGFRGDDRLVSEYLRDELMTGIDAADRSRLLETSVLDEITGELVDAVTERHGGAAWLRTTADSNQLVVPLDRVGTWFRYHHLLRDMLRREARQEIPERIPELHARAAEWFQRHGELGRAVEHRLAAGDRTAAVLLLATHGQQLLRNGQIDTLRGFLDQLGELTRTVTWCALLYGWCEYLAGRYSEADGWIDAMTSAAPDDFDHVVATSLRINVSLARGDVATALSAARQVVAHDELPTHQCDLATAVGAALAWAGQTDDARLALRYAADRAAAEHFNTAHVMALVYQAIVELDAGLITAANACATTALDAAGRCGLAEYHLVGAAYAVRARTGEDQELARSDTAHALLLARRASTDLALGYVLAASGDTLAAFGDPAGALLLHEARTIVDRCVDPGLVGRYLARARARHGLAGQWPQHIELVEHLTDRELAVLRYLPSAMSQREIATELYVSLNTVKTHNQAIYRKLGVTDRKSAIQMARDRELL